MRIWMRCSEMLFENFNMFEFFVTPSTIICFVLGIEKSFFPNSNYCHRWWFLNGEWYSIWWLMKILMVFLQSTIRRKFMWNTYTYWTFKRRYSNFRSHVFFQLCHSGLQICNYLILLLDLFFKIGDSWFWSWMWSWSWTWT